jgi:hypothetical protein
MDVCGIEEEVGEVNSRTTGNWERYVSNKWKGRINVHYILSEEA